MADVTAANQYGTDPLWNSMYANSPLYGAGYARDTGQPQTAASMQQPGVSLNQVSQGTNAAGGAGNYPAINPGEDSMAYMLRIGMSPQDAQTALNASRANPNLSFQQIMQQGGYQLGAPAPMAPAASVGTNASPTGSQMAPLGYTGPTSGSGPSAGLGVPPQIAQYLDPSMQFQMQQGLRALQSSAAAQGGLLSGNTLKDITNYSQGLASTAYNNAFNQAAQQQGFGANLAQNDWTNNLLLANTLAGQGQYGTSGAANTNNLLATLLSQNALAAGNANAAGTIGGSNAITGGLQQAIANMLSQNLINRIPQFQG